MLTRFVPDISFDPELANAMGEAFEGAWKSLKDYGSIDAKPSRAAWARETLALRIIETAQAGERDVNRLRDDAIAHLAHSKMQRPT